ncbi:MAG: hypothetical protein D6780_02460, partial [Candidatus Dadabacteria bacterium]
HKRAQRVRTALYSLLGLLVLIVITIFSLDYFANFPRERFARKYSYWQRAWYGFKSAARVVYLSLVTDLPDIKNTKLPVVEVYLKGKRLDKLTENLPDSGRIFQKGKVLIKRDNKQKTYKAQLKFRGDSVHHWAFPQKSWRVKLSGTALYNGIKEFNLNVPRSPTQLSNWLGYKMAQMAGITTTPEAFFTQFRLNRNFDGVRIFLEQPDYYFLRRKNLPLGKIFIGDIKTEDIYGLRRRKLLYKTPLAWEVRTPIPQYDNSRKEIKALIDTLEKNSWEPYKRFYALQDIVNIDSVLKVIALLEIVGSVHIDNTHNNKLYFNPYTGKFSVIPWDTLAYFWRNYGLDINRNFLFRDILTIPEWQ